jgi:uncharacterized protein (TIGR03067 family)
MKMGRGAAALILVGLAAVAQPARISFASALDGTWAVAQATLNGEPRMERKVLNSTWTFRGDELVMQQAGGLRSRWALAFDSAAEPPAFRATPLDTPGERPVWMILSRRHDELRLAFYDGLDRRPEDFGPRRKLVVLTLVPAAASAAADPCKILREAGADRLLGGPTRLRRESPRRSQPGVSCALERNDGSGTVSLTLIAPPAGTTYVDVSRRQAEAGRDVKVEDEPGLGASAFSGVRGWTVATVALKGGTAMLLRFEAPTVARAELRRFSERVLDRL